MELVLGIILLVAAVFLVIAVLMQSGKSHGLSGSIAGGAETFFGKTKGKTIDKMLSKITTVVAIIFAVLVIVVYVIQDDNIDTTGANTSNTTASITTAAHDTTVADDTTAPADTTVADDTTAADTTVAE